jgi:uncharacterized protein (TIGR03083 family)
VESDPKPWIAALRSSHGRLTALVEPLVPDGVEAPSMASEWTIAQVLSHLGSQADIFSSILDAAVTGRPLPGPDAFPPVWDEWNAKTPQAQVVDSLAANGAFLDQVGALTDAQLATLRFPMFGMDLDVTGFLRMRLNEHALHTWDVAAALDPAARVSSDAVDLAVDALPEMARRVGKTQEGPLRLRVVTTGPARDLVLVVGDEVAVDGWDGGPSDGVLRLPAEAWVRLVYGRLDAAGGPEIELDAEGVTLDRLHRVFPGL